MPKLVLFDIDGTLVLTGGAGIRAMNRAAETVMGQADVFAGVPVAGRTDWIILHDALAKLGRDLDDDLFQRFRHQYLIDLREAILERGTGTKAVMPGVRPLLDELQRSNGMALALLTGNFQEAARIKLEHFDLWRYFACGAFGDDAADRNALVPFAVDRARGCGVGDVPYSDVVVIGDTPNDVACARAVGARAIAVATGTYSVEQLRETGAPVVLQDLSDTARVMDLLKDN